MKCNLIVQLHQITIREYTHVDETWLIRLVSQRPYLTFSYKEDENEAKEKSLIMVIKGLSLTAVFSFLSDAGIEVRIIDLNSNI